MKAMVLHDWVKIWGTNLKLEERPKPKAADGEAVVRVSTCGVGSSVSNFLKGDMLPDKKYLPRIPGHEVAGTVDEIDPELSNVRVGDRVILYFYLTCDKCRYCIMGRQDHCENLRGFIGQHIDGGYAEYIKVPASNLFKLPESISLLDGTTICDAIATPYHIANDRARIAPGERVMIFGAAGGVGIHMVQVAKIFGAWVIAVDIGKEKLDAAKSVGADVTIDALSQNSVEEVKRYTDAHGADVVIDFVGNEQTMKNGIDALAKRGRFVQLTTHSGRIMSIENRRIVRDELNLIGSKYTTKHEFQQAIDLVSQKKVRPVITMVKKIEEVEDIHAVLEDGKLIGRGAMITE